jgi:TRAP-type mannitol/chloroaromatic compound transport system permease small subunit
VSVLLKFAAGMDWISSLFGKLAAWAVLAAALISAGNAFSRYGLDLSANSWLEIQWYLFAATVMLGAPMVLKLNEHVRVDIVYGKLGRNGPVYVDLFGLLFFLLPVMGLLTWLTWPFFTNMLRSGEMSGNIGGLIRWPAALRRNVSAGRCRNYQAHRLPARPHRDEHALRKTGAMTVSVNANANANAGVQRPTADACA